MYNDVLLGEQHPDGQWQWYLRAPQTDEPLLTLIDNQPYYYELDHRMMPVRLWDHTGQKVWESNADAWGKCQPDTLNNSIHQPLRLPGQFEDELTGIVQNRFRDYDPATGRYLTPDPLGVQGGLNTYRYTRNPVDYIDPLGLSSCETSGVTPEDAMKGEEGPVGDDGPAFQNIELAGAAALARAPAPVPTPPTSTVPRVITGAAANDAAYAVERSLLSRALPALGTAATFVTGMLYSPELGGGLEQVNAQDGTVYSKHSDERIWNAAGVDGSTWQTASPQEDMEYRTWLANGGDGSFEAWLAQGKPSEPSTLPQGGAGVVDNGFVKDPSSLLNQGEIQYSDIEQWAEHHELENQWHPNPEKFPGGGFSYEVEDGATTYKVHGHGPNLTAQEKWPESNAAKGPTVSIQKREGGKKPVNLMSDGSWGKFKSDPNSAHIPLTGSPY